MIAGGRAGGGGAACYAHHGQPMYGGDEEIINQQVLSENNSSNFLFNLSVLKNKVHQIQSLASILLSPENPHAAESATAVAIPAMSNLIQEIVVTASSMMFSVQQMGLGPPPPPHRSPPPPPERPPAAESGQEYFSEQPHHNESVDHRWYGDDQYHSCNDDADNNNNSNSNKRFPGDKKSPAKQEADPPAKYDIVELDAADLLAKYTHYCQVCGKGFKRDANLRMHMRAHGDEYKSSAALSNPTKKLGPSVGGGERLPRKYSCPHDGCRWNKNHAKFQPLKSMICVKNHYKRSHCPKMYVCKRCNAKHFSVLSDLRTHEKHCGDLKWQCSCGTTFSRKDKLMGHVGLFVGHVPVPVAKMPSESAAATADDES